MKSRLFLFLASFFFSSVLLAQDPCDVGWTTPTLTFSGNHSSSTMGLTLTGEDVLISADFTFDGSVSVLWQGCRVLVAPGASIVIEDGSTLTITNGTIITSTLVPWDGIDVLPGGTFVSSAQNTICNAIIAVDATGPGVPVADYDITNTVFRQNRTSLLVADHAIGPHPGIFQSNDIYGPNLRDGNPCATGVQLIGNGNLTGGVAIGGPLSSQGNEFFDLPNGIDANYSSLEAWNNVFTNIQANALADGTAIDADVPLVASLSLEIGGATNGNTFIDCRFGIRGTGYESTFISHNVMSSPSATFNSGMEIDQNPGGVEILYNRLSDFSNLGIICKDNLDRLSADNNTITGTAAGTRGIIIENQSDRFTADNNTIKNVSRGIVVENAPAVTTAHSISDNVIGFGNYLAGPFAAGIISNEADNVSIHGNTITGNCSGDCDQNTTFNRNVRGILQSVSLANILDQNSIDQCGVGAWIDGDTDQSNATCNAFDNCFTGFAFENITTANPYGLTISGITAVTGSTISPNVPSDNSWTHDVVTTPNRMSLIGVLGTSIDMSGTQWSHRSTPVQYNITGASITPGGACASGFCPTQFIDTPGTPCVPMKLATLELPASAPEITLIPNPSKGLTWIQSDFEGKGMLRLINLQGAVVIQQAADDLSQNYIDVSGLPRGIYIVEVIDEINAQVAREQLVIQ